jgi:hypothetical protein
MRELHAVTSKDAPPLDTPPLRLTSEHAPAPKAPSLFNDDERSKR